MPKVILEIMQIDAWRDVEGWNWNNSIKIADYTILDRVELIDGFDEKKEFLKALKKLGIVCPRGKCRVVNVGNGVQELQMRKTNEPMFAGIFRYDPTVSYD